MTLRGWSAVLFVAGCSAGAVPAASRPRAATSDEDSSFTVTRKSSSAPERGNASGVEPQRRVLDQSCQAESCEGDLPRATLAELSKTALLSQECYERELKDNADLEGKATLLLRLLDVATTGPSPCFVKVESSTFKLPPTLERCLLDGFSKLPARAQGGCVDVAVPLAFVRQTIEVPATGGAGGDTNAARPNPGGSVEP